MRRILLLYFTMVLVIAGGNAARIGLGDDAEYNQNLRLDTAFIFRSSADASLILSAGFLKKVEKMSEFAKRNACDLEDLSTEELLEREERKQSWIDALKWILTDLTDDYLCSGIVTGYDIRNKMRKELEAVENE